MKALDEEVIEEVEDAYEFADEAPEPALEALYRTSMRSRKSVHRERSEAGLVHGRLRSRSTADHRTS